MKFLAYALLMCCCIPLDASAASNWETVKDQASPLIAIPSAYAKPYRQALSNPGWEDGIHISRDGLNLYCMYAPVDLLAFIMAHKNPMEFKPYMRGETFGVDLKTTIPQLPQTGWLNVDILYAHRSSVDEPFTQWQLSGMARPIYGEGAPDPHFIAPNTVDMMFFTSNDSVNNNTDIWMLRNTTANPKGQGGPLPKSVNTKYNEDNPFVERADDGRLVLFFDSDNRPGGKGGHDIWYTTSADEGHTWSKPVNVSTVNTRWQDHQPHLFKDAQGQWYLYFSAPGPDGKLGIYRARQSKSGNWNSWVDKTLVIGAGNTAGVGEPTLTAHGDISFVVVYQNPQGSDTDRFDADPWFLPAR